MIRGYSQISNDVVGILYDVPPPVFPSTPSGWRGVTARHQYDESEYQYDLAPSMSCSAAGRLRQKKASVAGHWPTDAAASAAS